MHLLVSAAYRLFKRFVGFITTEFSLAQRFRCCARANALYILIAIVKALRRTT